MKGEGIVSRQTFPLGNLYNNTRMRIASAESENSLEKNKCIAWYPYIESIRHFYH